MIEEKIVLRRSAVNKNRMHNLYHNGHNSEWWWIHLSTEQGTMKGRLRFPLKTKSAEKAIAIRDRIISDAEARCALIWR